MKEFLDIARRWRETPVVDDDFVYLRDKFDGALLKMIGTLPKIVCLCGSTKFKKEFEEANKQETIAGNIVLSVGCFPHTDSGSSPETALGESIKTQLDALHKRKIDLADEVFVLNVGGYIGASTRSEIDYANTIGKPIRYLESSRQTERREGELL